MWKPVVAILTLCLAACTSVATLTKEQRRPEHYGAQPVGHEEAVKAYLQKTIFHPETARFEFRRKPYRGYSRHSIMLGGDPHEFGYIIEVSVDSKDLSGNDTGPQRKRVLMRDGVVLREIKTDKNFGEPWFD